MSTGAVTILYSFTIPKRAGGKEDIRQKAAPSGRFRSDSASALIAPKECSPTQWPAV